MSRSSVRKALQSDLELKHVINKLNTSFKADILSSRAAAPALYDALDAQNKHIPANHNSGGGRAEETGDRVNQQRIDRSESNNRTRAITGGKSQRAGFVEAG